MDETELGSAGSASNKPSIHVQRMGSPPGSRMARSPSRESIATELSFYSVSSLNSDYSKLTNTGIRIGFGSLKPVPESQLNCSPGNQHLSYLTPTRGPSPIPGSSGKFLKVPCSLNNQMISGCSLILPELCMEEETDLNLIKSCAALSSALGLQKSFSTGDIVSHVDNADNEYANLVNDRLRGASSEMALGPGISGSRYQYEASRLGMGSRTCSMWVAVGDAGALSLSRTVSSQLPSPQGRPASVHVDNTNNPAGVAGGGVAGSSSSASFTAADLIRSVNKRVRQHYIRRRLLTTYKALERLTQSQFNLDRIATVAVVPADTDSSTPDEVKGQSQVTSGATANSSWMKNALTITDVEREQGRPLSKYERNMIIFNWLHTLDESQSEVA